MKNIFNNIVTKILIIYYVIKNKMVTYVNNKQYLQLFISLLFIVIGLFGLSYSMIAFPWFSSYPAIVGNVGFALLLWWAIDTYFLKDFDLITEIRNGNISAAIYFLGYCLIILGSILKS